MKGRRSKKNPRDPRTWSNREIEGDSEGYVEAQQASREDRAAAEQERRDTDDLERFTERFVRDGGRRSEAAAAFWTDRARRAAEAAALEAEQADAAASATTRRRVRGAL
jgi:hypothetical protein